MNTYLKCLLLVNFYRNLHQVGNVTYSKALEQSAKSWSDYLATNDLFEHSNSRYGENLAMTYTWNTNPCTNAVERWYDESINYNYSNTGFEFKSGHFTQLVWKDTREIGVGIAKSNKTNKVYVTMQYYPPGNYRGVFKENVFPPLQIPPQPSPPPPYPSLPPPPPPLKKYPPLQNVLMTLKEKIKSQHV